MNLAHSSSCVSLIPYSPGSTRINSIQSLSAADGSSPEHMRNGMTFTPRVDILETRDELMLFADLPGVKPEDLDVRFEKDELTIYGKVASRQENAQYLSYEYGVGDFYRAFSISEHIDWQKIAAEFKNGVLTVHLPKAETVKPKKINVKGE